MLSPNVKHGIHCFVFTFLIAFFIFKGTRQTETYVSSPIDDYGYLLTILLYTIQLLPLLMVPIVTENVLGLLLFNSFKEVKLRCSPEHSPFVCFRIITRGDFPSMVKRNVELNRMVCYEAGLKHFVVEVVTEKPIGVPTTAKTREVVVPPSYTPKGGTVFKGRVCQYVLEEENYNLQDDDWVVQLDGILNFISIAKHKLGQGVINFANQGVVNWLVTLIDCVRVADDLGRMQWELKVYHRPMSGWKGCFIVVQAGVERKVNYDFGVEHSISEENNFRLEAIARGYTFGFVEGEMWEKSPFTIWDLIEQRKRWMQGRMTFLQSSPFPIKIKWLTVLITIAWISLPLNLLAIPLRHTFPLPGLWSVNVASNYLLATALYMYIFGVIKSFDITKIGLVKFLLYLVGTMVAFPVDIALQVPIIILAVCTNRGFYYIVEKEEEKIA